MKTFIKSDIMLSLYSTIICLYMTFNTSYILESLLVCSIILCFNCLYGILHDVESGYGIPEHYGNYDLCKDNIYKSFKKRLIILVNNV